MLDMTAVSIADLFDIISKDELGEMLADELLHRLDDLDPALAGEVYKLLGF